MPISVQLRDGRGGKNYHARVSSSGELAVGPVAYDLAVFNRLNAADTAFNFYEPLPGKQLVITGMRVKANRDVSNVTDATVIIHEADSPASTTVDRILHQDALIRGEGADLIPLNILVNEGAFVNAKTSEPSIFITIWAHFIEVVA